MVSSVLGNSGADDWNDGRSKCSPKFFRLSFATNSASPRAGLVSLLKAFNHNLSTVFANESKACNSERFTTVFAFVASSFLVVYNAYLAKAWDRARW